MVIVIYPAGLMNLLRHFQHEYKNPEIFIMENGWTKSTTEPRP
ncbi:hypothetical protein BRARA_B02289 [Brassica rapa]|uniref:thioglucosidase n=1 Tax=Brassica campestris TaxID=3711 RepID=A0A398AF49_BRACM|nr:hypothetical protein BRARA_B02289 [Brassica rapa]